MVQVMTMAFLVVGAGCMLMVPVMLYVLRLPGWTWAHACMFGAMVASTDAVAIVAIMRTSERALGCRAVEGGWVAPGEERALPEACTGCCSGRG
jgi:NhaP-type Na+/H+ or K+/H+ antiporter